MSKNDTIALETALEKLLEADVKTTKPTETDVLHTFSAEPYKDGLPEGGLTVDAVVKVNTYNKAFTRASLNTAHRLSLASFKEDSKVETASTNAIPMLGNKLEIHVDRVKTLKNPGTGEAIVRHGYVTVAATVGYASGKDIKTLRDELMEAGKSTLG